MFSERQTGAIPHMVFFEFKEVENEETHENIEAEFLDDCNLCTTVIEKYREYCHKIKGVNLTVNIYYISFKVISSNFNALLLTLIPIIKTCFKVVFVKPVQGSAAEVLQEIPADKLADLTTIEKALESRFGDSHLTQFYRTELKTRRQKPGENVQPSLPERCPCSGLATLFDLKKEAIPTRVLNLDNKPKTTDKGDFITTCEPVVDIVARPQKFSEALHLPSILENLEGLNEEQRTAVSEDQIAGWIQRLQEYDFKIQHRNGTSHGNADALSRRPCKESCKH
ncbi:hypothetical protein AVEN_236642-1 [Araneus ventricosus]|uniref:Uncharacterized protein n=1 Tax=Araneus ventricosus TaxID=182803 RepID=A0A4Y2KWH9_ARAVE|nr:hypothetical protein AVEN_236642-1 [Araneus ventricosus]